MKLSLCVAVIVLLAAVGCDRGAPEPEGAAMSATELAERLEAGTAPVVLDVRTPEEFAQGHIPGAVNIPYDELSSRLGELPAGKSDEIVVHCQSGRRAEFARGTLDEAGYANVRDLEGHWEGWRGAELPTE